LKGYLCATPKLLDFDKWELVFHDHDENQPSVYAENFGMHNVDIVDSMICRLNAHRLAGNVAGMLICLREIAEDERWSVHHVSDPSKNDRMRTKIARISRLIDRKELTWM